MSASSRSRPPRRPTSALGTGALALLLLACGPGADAPAEADDRAAVEVVPGSPAADRFVTGGLVPIGGSRDEIRTSLGEPDSVSREAVANRHVAGQTDTLVTLHYPALAATVYAVTGGGDLLQSVRVSGDRHLRDPAIRIGMPWEEVRRRLGEPARSEDGVYTYVCRTCEGAENPVLVHVRDGLVEAIEFTYYVD